MMLFLRSLAFNIAFYLLTALCLLAFSFSLLGSREQLMALVRWYLRRLHWLERRVIGLDYRVLGWEHTPSGACLVAAKHQSVWETMKLHLLLDDPAVVLKRELTLIPIWGQLARKARMIEVDRRAGKRAVNSMVESARPIVAEGRPIVIFPQGTRVAPGAWRPYKIGVWALYERLGLPVVPMALNSGLFWPRRRFLKRPGLITVEFLPPIPPGLDRESFMTRLETELEAASERLSLAAGGPPTERTLEEHTN